MAQVTVEGTETPSTFLPRGHVLTVERTAFIDKLIRNGFIRLVATAGLPVLTAPAVGGEVQPTPADPDSVPVVLSEGGPVVPDPESSPDSPSRAGSRDVWANFLTEQGIAFPEGATRDALIALWDGRG